MRPTFLGVFAAAVVFPAAAQYPGQPAKKDNAPELRSVAVLEWVGDAGKPKSSRLVPISVYDGQELQDGGEYLARPQPLAVDGDTEYVLQKDGKRVGLYDVDESGKELGTWVGFGDWKPMPSPVVKPSTPEMAKVDEDDAADDRPVLHRKHHADDGTGSSAGGGNSSAGGQAPAPDPDQPTLHRKSSTDDSGSDSGAAGQEPAPDPDQPTLHRASTADSGSAADDNGGLTMKKDKKKKKVEDAGYVEDLPNISDPDRPRLLLHEPSGPRMIPKMMGLPADLQQMVAVSDATNRPPHPWNYSWANPDDELKMKAQLEDVARKVLGLIPPPAPAPVRKRTTTHRRKAKPAPPLPPAPLEDEQFRVFELAYGSGATLVLTADTGGPLEQEKFVTLIAQPDLYGSLLVLFKSVTDGTHLDETPRMHLIDAVDAMADNRGELLFELRGANQRQFALYRVLRGSAEKLFVTGGGYFGSPTMN